MANTTSMQRLAHVLRRYPWIVVAGRWVWRLARPKFSCGVVGVVFDTTGQVLMVEHVFHPYHPWGLPGGWVERREDPTVSLQREFHEELGLEVTVGPVVAVGTEFANHIDLAYLCFTQSQVGSLSFELLSYRWFDPAALPVTHTFHARAVQQAQLLAKIRD
jgi:ADP-ribose pyrophosphatase YjhB (NUDIX family)